VETSISTRWLLCRSSPVIARRRRSASSSTRRSRSRSGRVAARSSRSRKSSSASTTACFSRTTSSAAADGVGARRSATKSAIVKSTSWPTAEMTGAFEAAIARNVARGGAPRGGVTTALLWGKRRSPLSRHVEQAFGLEPCLQLLERELERAEPLGLEQLHDQLVLSALRVHLDRAERDHVEAVGRLEADPLRARPEDHAAELGVGVLQGEVGVAGAVGAEV